MARRYAGAGRYKVKTLGCADDTLPADGVTVLTFRQAQEMALRHQSLNTISRLEMGETDTRGNTLRKVQQALETAGVEFTWKGEGVRLRELP